MLHANSIAYTSYVLQAGGQIRTPNTYFAKCYFQELFDKLRDSKI